VLLALGAVLSGYIGYKLLNMVDGHGHFWGDAIFVLEANNTLEAAHHVPQWVMLLPIGVAIAGIALAWLLYMKWTSLPAKFAKFYSPVYKFLLNKWYFDELYNAVFVNGAKKLGNVFWKVGDVKIIDGLGPNGFAWVSARLAERTSKLQSGFLYHYAFAMLVGLALLITWLMFGVLGGE